MTLAWNASRTDPAGMRLLRAFTLVALVAMAALSARPLADDVFGVKPDPSRLTVTSDSAGSHRCFVAGECETMLATHVAFNIDLDAFLAGSTGLTTASTVREPRAVTQTAPGLLEPPPPRLASL